MGFNILVLGVKVPFTRGGQDVLVKTLVNELTRRGHNVDTVELPYTSLPKASLLNQAALWRALDLEAFGGKNVDLVIATKFPSYYARHPRKSLWLVHQHRAIYELYGGRFSDVSDDPRDEAMRRMLVEGDNETISECAVITGISRNVVERLERFNGIRGTALYPPLANPERYRCAGSGDYILSVGRLCGIKRVDMLLRALPSIHLFVKLKVVGTPDEPGIMEYFMNEIDKHHLRDRVEFLGRVSDDDLLDLYANALGVYYAPFDEDYGYVTLEAMASSKPVVTASDSGGVLEFIENDVHGYVTEPNPDAVAAAFNKLIEDRELAARLGASGRAKFEQLGFLTASWDTVVDSLLVPVTGDRP